jgi:hypothetical protein
MLKSMRGILLCRRFRVVLYRKHTHIFSLLFLAWLLSIGGVGGFALDNASNIRAIVTSTSGSGFTVSNATREATIFPFNIPTNGLGIQTNDVIHVASGAFVDVRLLPGSNAVRLAENSEASFISLAPYTYTTTYGYSTGRVMSMTLIYGRARITNIWDNEVICVRVGNSFVEITHGDVNIDYLIQTGFNSNKPVLTVSPLMGTAVFIPNEKSPGSGRYTISEDESVTINTAEDKMERRTGNAGLASYWNNQYSGAGNSAESNALRFASAAPGLPYYAVPGSSPYSYGGYGGYGNFGYAPWTGTYGTYTQLYGDDTQALSSTYPSSVPLSERFLNAGDGNVMAYNEASNAYALGQVYTPPTDYRPLVPGTELDFETPQGLASQGNPIILEPGTSLGYTRSEPLAAMFGTSPYDTSKNVRSSIPGLNSQRGGQAAQLKTGGIWVGLIAFAIGAAAQSYAYWTYDDTDQDLRDNIFMIGGYGGMGIGLITLLASALYQRTIYW